MEIGYVNVFVSDLKRALTFYHDTLGLTLHQADEEHGYASLGAKTISFGLAQTDEPGLIGRHTGIGFVVSDIETKHRDLAAKGVNFTLPPTPQPWGGILAVFEDPDGNQFYLDPGFSDSHQPQTN